MGGKRPRRAFSWDKTSSRSKSLTTFACTQSLPYLDGGQALCYDICGHGGCHRTRYASGSVQAARLSCFDEDCITPVWTMQIANPPISCPQDDTLTLSACLVNTRYLPGTLIGRRQGNLIPVRCTSALNTAWYNDNARDPPGCLRCRFAIVPRIRSNDRYETRGILDALR